MTIGTHAQLTAAQLRYDHMDDDSVDFDADDPVVVIADARKCVEHAQWCIQKMAADPDLVTPREFAKQNVREAIEHLQFLAGVL